MGEPELDNQLQPSEVDLHVGARLRSRRKFIGLSQEKIGQKVGLTFQQIQKYELGKNRISAGILYQFSTLLDVPVSYFFEGLEGAEHYYHLPANGNADEKDVYTIVKNFEAISDPYLKKCLIDFIHNLAAGKS